MELTDYEELASGPKKIEDLPTPHVPAINWPEAIGFLISVGIAYLLAWWARFGF